MFIDAVFYLVSILLISNSLLILFSKNVYRSAVFLAFSMLCFAAMYFMLSAEFIGVIQILVYVGAVSVLIALSVMLVKDIEKSTDNNKLLYYSSIIGLIFLQWMNERRDFVVKKELRKQNSFCKEHSTKSHQILLNLSLRLDMCVDMV